MRECRVWGNSGRLGGDWPKRPVRGRQFGEAKWRRLCAAVAELPDWDAEPLGFVGQVPRTSRFGSPLVLSRVHRVRPELVAEVKFLTWTDDNLLRQVVYEGLREDKPAAEVRRPIPHPKPVMEGSPSRSTKAAGPKVLKPQTRR
jgi:hypothetical protein